MSTPFYDEKYSRLFPVTFLFLERLEHIAKSSGIPEITEAIAMQAVLEFFPAVEDIDEALEYLRQRVNEPPKQPSTPSKTKRPGKTFGAAITDFYKGFKPWEEMVAAWGWEEARRMYCEEDKEDVLSALSVWHRKIEGQHSMVLEAVSYGFGNRYKDDHDGELEVIDLSKGGDDAFLALQEAINKANKGFH